jgi:polar amino acid transport system substrate-binding protein
MQSAVEPPSVMFFFRTLRGIALIGALSVFLTAVFSVAGPRLGRDAVAQDAPVTIVPPVVIPDFWDPRRRIERPPAGTVQAIRFITTDDFPPFNFLDANRHLTGFNVDLARAICAELAIRCTIQAREWSELTDRLIDKSADAAIAGIAITAKNRDQLDFSDIYLRTPARFVVRRADAQLQPTPDGLKGKTLAVVQRTAHEAYLAAMFPEVARKLYPSADAAREALKKGEVDAHFGDGLALSFWLQSEGAADCCVFAGGPYLESRFFGQGYAIAMAKGPTEVKRAINAALQTLYEKGIYAELYLRYFPVGFF